MIRAAPVLALLASCGECASPGTTDTATTDTVPPGEDADAAEDCATAEDQDGDGLGGCDDDDCFGPVCHDWAAVVTGGTLRVEGEGQHGWWCSDAPGGGCSSTSRGSFALEVGDVEGVLTLRDTITGEETRCGWTYASGSHAGSYEHHTETDANGETEVEETVVQGSFTREGFAVEPPCRAVAADILPGGVWFDGTAEDVEWYGGTEVVATEEYVSYNGYVQGSTSSSGRTVFGYTIALEARGARGTCGAGTPRVVFPDVDGDGWGDGTTGWPTCDTLPVGHVVVGGDCNDLDLAVRPDAEETCDTPWDDDCDGAVTCERHVEELVGPTGDGDPYVRLDVDDLDGDGASDLLLVRYDGDTRTHTTYLLPGPLDGTGAYRDALALDAITLDVGDVDGDGHADLVAQESSRSETWLVLHGPFRPGEEPRRDELFHGTTVFPRLVSDVDGDGRPDVLTSSDLRLSGSDYEVVGKARCAKGALDVDGDGLADLVAGDEERGVVEVFLAPYPGDGNWLPAADVVLESPDAMPEGFGDLTVGPDGDGDGYAELWVSNAPGPYDTCKDLYHTYRRTPRVRLFDGPLLAEEAATVGWSDRVELAPLGLGDVDGDGRQDLVAVEEEAVRVVPGPFGGWVSAGDAPARFGLPTDDVEDLEVGDVDGDGLDDVVLSRDYGDDGIDVIRGATFAELR